MITADAAGTWTIGDLTVNRIGFGVMRLTGNGVKGNSDGPPIDRGRAIGILRRAVELGVNHIDTAAFYFAPLRSANELINSALAPYPDDLVIATKVGPSRDASGEWQEPATPAQLRGQVEENLRQLGRDHLDLVYFRRQSSDSIAEHFGALAELRDAGLIRHLGISGIRADDLAEAQAISPVACVQNAYSLDSRRADENGLIDLCKTQGIAFVPYFAIAGNQREAPASDTHDDQVLAIARAHDVSPMQVRLAWTLHRGSHVLAIPGTGDPAHLAANIEAGALRLSADELASLTGQPAPPPAALPPAAREPAALPPAVRRASTGGPDHDRDRPRPVRRRRRRRYGQLRPGAGASNPGSCRFRQPPRVVPDHQLR
jgi:aryl-alcohol dehydrogenase-like predicted oxidoreductase